MTSPNSKLQSPTSLRDGMRLIENELLKRPTGPVQMTDKSQTRILRRQNTYLRNAKRKLEAEAKAHRAGLRVIKWARRCVNGGTDWDDQQLERAVAAYERMGL